MLGFYYSQMKSPQIYCKSIPYRSGLIEVLPNVHAGHVNIEVWNLHPDCNYAPTDIRDGSISDEDVIGHTEIELDIAQAKTLVALLQLAIEAAEK